MSITSTKRKINYFKLKFDFNEGYDLSHIKNIFDHISSENNTSGTNRYFVNKSKILNLVVFSNDVKESNINATIRNVRKDSFPELIDTFDDKVRDIEAKESEGVLEKSHFILSYITDPIILALEFNQYGPRINDVVYCLEKIGKQIGISKKIEFIPYSTDDLSKIKLKMNRISSIIATVHKDNVQRVNEVDSEFFSAIRTIEKMSEAEYVTLDLKYDIRNEPQPTIMSKAIENIFNKLIAYPVLSNIFYRFKIKAQDKTRNNKMKEFDILNIWQKSEVSVQLKEKSRTIISLDMFEKMKIELKKEFQR